MPLLCALAAHTAPCPLVVCAQRGDRAAGQLGMCRAQVEAAPGALASGARPHDPWAGAAGCGAGERASARGAPRVPPAEAAPRTGPGACSGAPWVGTATWDTSARGGLRGGAAGLPPLRVGLSYGLRCAWPHGGAAGVREVAAADALQLRVCDPGCGAQSRQDSPRRALWLVRQADKGWVCHILRKLHSLGRVDGLGLNDIAAVAPHRGPHALHAQSPACQGVTCAKRRRAAASAHARPELGAAAASELQRWGIGPGSAHFVCVVAAD